MRKNYLKRNTVFLILSAAACIDAVAVFATAPKGESVLFINGLSNAVLDSIFVAITHSGLGISLLLASLLLAFRKVKYAFAGITALALTGALTYALKQLVFSGAVRPIGYFSGLDLNFISGFDYSYANTFPSGHTMSAFAFACVASAVSRNTLVQVLLFVYAALVGLSRMYLLQHFLEDVTAGALMGIACGHFALWLWSGSRARWMHQPLHLLWQLPERSGTRARSLA